MLDQNGDFVKQQEMPRNVWALGFVSMLMDVSSEMIHSLLPLFLVNSLGAGTVIVGLIEGAAEATALIVKIFSGTLSDQLGKRKILALAGYALGALTKPIFAIAQTAGVVLFARLADRTGKGIRGAPRDALIADVTPAHLRGAAYGLRQSLDTIGALAGPLLAAALMAAWNSDFRAVFLAATIPGFLSVAVLALGVREPSGLARNSSPLTLAAWRSLSPAFWWIVATGAMFTLARFSEAFLVLRAHDAGIALAAAPLVMAAMNVSYGLTAYPFGRLSDRANPDHLLMVGLAVLIAADLLLARASHWAVVVAGVLLWGIHMGITQGLLAKRVADTAPADLRGTAFGVYNLASGLAMLAASAIAGLLWSRYGAPSTFYAGAAFCAIAIAAVRLRPNRTGRSV